MWQIQQAPENLECVKMSEKKIILGQFSRGKTIVYMNQKICGVNAEKANNAWARKTFINTALHELLLPEQMIMNVSGHKSAAQMRADYCVNLETQTRSRAKDTPGGRGRKGKERQRPNSNEDTR